ncbi:flagellar biosynthesis protein FliQ [Pseudothermotoga thermarum]|uniref:Flagellar biosynthetic protein FliQ n=1 Tax=Pseudothermotoga thermarum DSM 5069 TaxID=688269 RepID=F7YXY3_9THEM|nr:flagellar biosynthesis protein FliQ [Pseudothermotoga thermarum]AEH50782.1 flagellar biosynthetic protein FliQ [Pseudothermotoga thermarum DSM 5069]
MTIDVFVDIVKQGVQTVILVITPPLLVSLIVGLVISIFQAVTQIHEQTLTFAPKIILVLLTVALLGSWMLQKLVEYSQELLEKYMGMI